MNPGTGTACLAFLVGLTGCFNSFTPKPAPPLSTWYHGFSGGARSIGAVGGTFTSGVCHLGCAYRITAKLTPGYSRMEIFLTGWEATNLGGPTTVQRIGFGVDSVVYDSVSGDSQWDAVGEVRSNERGGDEFRFKIQFMVVLTKSKGTNITRLVQSCASQAGGSCHTIDTIANPLPPGWTTPLIGIQRFYLETGTGGSATGIDLNRIGIDATGWHQSGGHMVAPISCAMHDATPSEPMQCGIETVRLAADSMQVFRMQFNSNHSLSHSLLQYATLPPWSGPPVDGYLGGMEGFSLAFQNQKQAKTWAWGAGYSQMGRVGNPSGPPNVFGYYEQGFLGDKFNVPVNTLPFDLQLSGFGNWTRP